jgi:hypothetical protein
VSRVTGLGTRRSQYSGGLGFQPPFRTKDAFEHAGNAQVVTGVFTITTLSALAPRSPTYLAGVEPFRAMAIAWTLSYTPCIS